MEQALRGSQADQDRPEFFASWQFLNSYCVEGLGAEHSQLREGFETALA